MINDASVQAVANAQWNGHPQFIRPLYSTYCFSQLPRLVRSLFAGGDNSLQRMLIGPLAGAYDKVVLFFVDAFGWRFFERYANSYPFLRRIELEGYVTKLTSQFPSTTAAHVTAIHTGLPVGQSGVYEWYYYEPLVDAIIAPLMFSYAGDEERGTLLGKIEQEALLPDLRQTLYEDLADLGVCSMVFGHESYTSPGNVLFRGAEVAPYKKLSEALSTLGARLQADPSPAYYFLYTSDIDSVCHEHGPNSLPFEGEVDAFLTLMEESFMSALRGQHSKTLFLMTADHGQVEVSPSRVDYLDIRLPEIKGCIKTNRQGQLLAPAGSARDMFTHIKDEYLEEAQALLRNHLAGKAEVHTVKDLIEQGFFGTDYPSQTFMGRVGNLVILPYSGEQVWWSGGGKFKKDFLGHHGGLTRAEMETVLLAQAYP